MAKANIQPLPYPAPQGGNYSGFTREQLLANLKVADANVKAVGGRPTGGDASQYWQAHEVEAGVNSALTALFHAVASNAGKTAPSLQANIKAAG